MFIQPLVSIYIIVPNPALPVADKDIHKLEFGTEFFLGYYSFSVARTTDLASFLSQKSPQRQRKNNFFKKGSNHLIAMAQTVSPRVLIPCIVSKTS